MIIYVTPQMKRAYTILHHISLFILFSSLPRTFRPRALHAAARTARVAWRALHDDAHLVPTVRQLRAQAHQRPTSARPVPRPVTGATEASEGRKHMGGA